MVSYDYKCGKCGKEFTVMMAISEHGTKKVHCPKCKSVKVARQITGFFCQTSKKS